MNRARTLVLAVALFFTSVSVASAPRAEAQGSGAATAADSVLVAGAGPDSVLVAGTAADSVPGYVAQVRANFTTENRAYSRIRTVLRLVSPFYGILTALLLLVTGVSARLRDFAYARSSRRYLRVLAYLVPFLIIGFALDFPLSYYSGFVLEHRFGLSNQNFGEWFGDEAKGLLVGLVMLGATGLLALVFRVIEKHPRRWWLLLSLGTLPLILLQVLIEPVIIDPLFNKFVPLQNERLRGEILSLAAKAEIPSRRVYQVDKSRQTKKLNAYVSGFGASQRIVLWDTTLERMKEDEILFVMGHEMGHYKLAHIWKGIAFFVVLSFGVFWVAWALAGGLTRIFGPRWGFTQVHDLASLPMLFAILGLMMFLLTPMINAFTRTIEHEADVFALEVTHSNDAGARAFIQLGAANKSDPEPSAVMKSLLYSHPPLIERIRFALEYRPWEQGRPNRAFKPGS